MLSLRERLTNGDEGSNFVVPASSDLDPPARPTVSNHAHLTIDMAGAAYSIVTNSRSLLSLRIHRR
jgi:hypothetical protein